MGKSKRARKKQRRDVILPMIKKLAAAILWFVNFLIAVLTLFKLWKELLD